MENISKNNSPCMIQTVQVYHDKKNMTWLVMGNTPYTFISILVLYPPSYRPERSASV